MKKVTCGRAIDPTVAPSKPDKFVADMGNLDADVPGVGRYLPGSGPT